MSPRLLVIVLAAAVVGVAAYQSRDRLGPLHREGNALRITFAYSPNQEDLLVPLIRKFNHERHRSGSRVLKVEGESIPSGDAEGKIAARQYRPTIWSPASSLWGRLLNFQVRRNWVADENPSFARTPLVIALWKPEAEALGWPDRPIGFDVILKLARSRTGWAAYGLPTFGRFKLGHTNPDFSTSGLSFVAAQYYNATGKREGLTVGDVRRGDVRAKVRQIQQSIVHYGDTSAFFLEELKQHGAGYVSAVAMEEVTLLDYNRTRPKGSMPLVAVYPAEGTFDFDNPLIALRAPWVNARQREAAKTFERWLLPRVTAELAARYGYRPGDPASPASAPIDRAHLVDPQQPRYVLSLPEPRVLATIKSAWHEDRKAANVGIVVDTSGSMNEERKLTQAREGLKVFLRQFSPRDRVGLVTFSTTAYTVVPIGEVRANRSALQSAVANLTAAGGTAVYDATARGVDLVAALRDSTRINAVVVLTDGEDNESQLTSKELETRLEQRAEDQEQNIRVFTIAYGGHANNDVLEDIAAASGGQAYEGDPEQIAGVYRQISSFF
ncbi:MAG: substrate-binding and VWA domain-containing protein [Actinomycetota bacterium]|nr:substrate-binding and VWA domain-containing protein [Actinomycetota bacterium]